uniref:hypothetical protein n=1 Tax=Prevotella sp. TaxID=59823 RepID=UPI0040291E29
MGKSTEMFFENKIKQFDHDLSIYLDRNDGDMRSHAEEVLNAEMIEKFKTFSKEIQVELLGLLFKKRFRRKWIFNKFRFCVVQACFFAFTDRFVDNKDKALTV